MAVATNGDLLIAENTSHRIRRVDAQTGITTTFAGTGEPIFLGDGGQATEAGLGYVYDIAFKQDGVLYIVASNRVRRVDPTDGTLETGAGSDRFGYLGDGGPAADAALNGIVTVEVDREGNVFVASHYGVVRAATSPGI